MLFSDILRLKTKRETVHLKHKALLAGILAAAAICLSGCGELTGEKAFFSLQSAGDVRQYDIADDTVLQRADASLAGGLVTSDVYGEIVPFAGEMINYKNDGGSFTAPLLGFCRVDGTVICDPYYDAVITHDVGDKYIYELVIGSTDTAGTRYLAASDGSWMFELKNGCSYLGLAGSERFAVKRPRTVRKGGKRVTYEYYDYYDLSGNLVFTFDRKMTEDETLTISIGAFSEGLAPVNVQKTDPDTEETQYTAYYMDTNGDVFESDDYIYCSEFKRGYAVVADADGNYGVLKPDGEYFIEPKYNAINYNYDDGWFSCGEEGIFYILDMNGNQAASVLCEKGNVYAMGSTELIYKKTMQSTGKSDYYSVTANKPFMCNETGQFPSEDSGRYGIYYSSYSNVTDVFDETGKTLANFTGFGRVEGKLGDIAIISDKTGGKTAFLNVKTGDKTDWKDYAYTGDVFGTRVILEGADGYLIYDTAAPDSAEAVTYAAALETAGGTYLNVLSSGYVTLYDDAMNVLMKYKYEAEAAL